MCRLSFQLSEHIRMYRRILLVAVLTIVFVAAGIGWVRFYLSPLAEHAAQKPASSDDVADDLPRACLDELASIDGRTGSLRDESYSARAIAGDAGYQPPSESRNVLREESPARPSRTNETANDTEVAPDRLAVDDDAARPISSAQSGVQSAEWNASAAPSLARSKGNRAARTATLPVSVEETLPMRSFDALKAVDVLDLMRRLRSESEAERTPARQELLRRGFSEVDLELARQLFSPDAEARKQLASAVPRLASVDAAKWLMWLAADPQPEVRLAAITTLATTGDPTLLDRVEALARKDADPQVQAVADQIAKQRDLAASRGGRLK
jgi:hypothetical protein